MKKISDKKQNNVFVFRAVIRRIQELIQMYSPFMKNRIGRTMFADCFIVLKKRGEGDNLRQKEAEIRIVLFPGNGDMPPAA